MMTKQELAFARRDRAEKMNGLYRGNGEAGPYRGAVYGGGNRRRHGYTGALTVFGALVVCVGFTALVSLLVWHVWVCL